MCEKHVKNTGIPVVLIQNSYNFSFFGAERGGIRPPLKSASEDTQFQSTMILVMLYAYTITTIKIKVVWKYRTNFHVYNGIYCPVKADNYMYIKRK